MLVLFVSVGCSQEKEVIKNEKNKNTSVGNAKHTSQKPPSLKISVDEEEFMTAMNGYAWSYFDEEENTMVGIEAESASASELVGDWKAPAVNSDTSIELKFEEEPISYYVNVWGSLNNMKGSSKDVVLARQSGRTIYEVVATWERGTGHYVFPLFVE